MKSMFDRRLKGSGLCCLFIAYFMSGYAHAYNSCQPVATGTGGFGPYDYWTDSSKLPGVENFHFTPEVEQLRKGKSTTVIGADIDYTLTVFPNHPRALLAMMKLAEREKTDRPMGAKVTIGCYFERATQFSPNDAMAHLIYGTYLAKKGKGEEALQHYEIAQKNAEYNGNIHYNLGLAFFDLKRYEESLQHAHEAYRLGFSLPGLRNKLQKAGRWRDPVPVPVENAQEESSKETSTNKPSQ